MSSVLLYLAIVVMWLCVLVPMWLRRDRATFTELTEDAEPYVQDEEEQPSEDSIETQRDIVLPSASPSSVSWETVPVEAEAPQEPPAPPPPPPPPPAPPGRAGGGGGPGPAQPGAKP
ncbi:hypothetical protein ABT338_20025, partial [Streptosporangium saharense]